MPNTLSRLKEMLFTTTACYYLILGLLSTAFMMLIIYFIAPQKPAIATVDVTRMVNQFVQAQIKLNLPKQELQQRVKTFGAQLETTLNAVAKKQKVVLVPSEAVIAGGKDLTPLVQKDLEHLLMSKR